MNFLTCIIGGPFMRATFILRCGVLVVLGLMWVSGHPPAKAQKSDMTVNQRMQANKDEAQDIAIDHAQTYQQQQDGWNRLTGDQIKGLEARMKVQEDHSSHLDGVIEGGIYFSGAMTFLAAFFQLRKKVKKEED